MRGYDSYLVRSLDTIIFGQVIMFIRRRCPTMDPGDLHQEPLQLSILGIGI